MSSSREDPRSSLAPGLAPSGSGAISAGLRDLRSLRRRAPSTDYLFLAPAVLFLLLFAVYPIAMTVIYSFQKVTVAGLMTRNLPFVGLLNYFTVLRDPAFMQAAYLSAIFTVASVFFQFIFGFALALLFNTTFPLRSLLRGLIMLGWVLPLIVVGTTFKWMFQSSNGIFNTALKGLFGPAAALPWLEQSGSALVAIIVANIWLGIPFMFAMLLAGLQTIPVPVYEAARIDGASAWGRFRYITLPLMRGPSLIVLTLSVIYTLNVFEIILIITGGGPGAATSVVTYYAYQQGFNFFKLGPASAVTVLVFLVLAVISAIYIRLLHSSEKT
jgi:multiple sugar transport system permease protein